MSDNVSTNPQELGIVYALEPELIAEEFIDVLRRSTLAERRPVNNLDRIKTMLREAEVIITARVSEGNSGSKLVGVSRAISDRAYCTYLSDLAVDQEFQRRGIGKELIRRTHAQAGPDTTLILLSAPKAQAYYPHIGMSQHPSCWTQAFDPQLHAEQSVEKLPQRSDPKRVGVPSAANSSEQIADFFDNLAEEYEASIERCVPRYSEMLWGLFEYLPNALRPQRILELGCGTGNLTSKIVERFPAAEIIGIDLSQESIQRCRERLGAKLSSTDLGRVQLQVQDMRRLDFGESSFDLILSTISIHHLTSGEKRKLFKQCRGWLAEHGVLAFSDQFAGGSQEIYDKHIQRWHEYAVSRGASDDEWQTWMRHQEDHDFHDSLSNQMTWLRDAGFSSVDCPWRYLLWTVLIATGDRLSSEAC